MSTPLPHDYLASAVRWFGRQAKDMDATARRVLARASRRQLLIETPNQRIDAQTTFGERIADKVAAFGGSWAFIILFGVVLLAWVALNSEFLGKSAFDPYPFIFLNLILSMLAAIQAPVIMMSQNRQSTKDRQMAAYDYEVNLRAEVEIMALHEKLDALRGEQMMQVIAQQQTQIELLTRMIDMRNAPPAPDA